MAHDRLLRAALSLAARRMHVFPLWPQSKVPAVRRDWEVCATTDPNQIARWWGHAPYNIGIATGPSSLVVVDLDAPKPPREPDGTRRPHGRESLAAHADAAGRAVPTDTLTVATAGAGEHLYFRAPDGLTLRNTAGRIGVNIDTRASGGYVVGPGSRMGRHLYRAVNSAEAMPLPDWLLAALRPPPPRPRPRTASRHHGSAYIRAAVEGEARRVADAPVGQRNDTLFRAAAALSRFVQEGRLAGNDVHTALDAAVGRHIGIEGFSAEEARKTIASALRRSPHGPVSVAGSTRPARPGLTND